MIVHMRRRVAPRNRSIRRHGQTGRGLHVAVAEPRAVELDLLAREESCRRDCYALSAVP